MRPRIDPGQMTAAGMVLGILFGWGVLALTRDEVRETFADIGERLDSLEGHTELLFDHLDMTTNLAGRPQEQPTFRPGGRRRLHRVSEPSADEAIDG